MTHALVLHYLRREEEQAFLGRQFPRRVLNGYKRPVRVTFRHLAHKTKRQVHL